MRAPRSRTPGQSRCKPGQSRCKIDLMFRRMEDAVPKTTKPARVRAQSVAITGARGDWIVDVEGERLAVIHDTWWTGKDAYRDPMVGIDVASKRYLDYVATLQETDRVVVQRDKGNGSLARDGYVGVFSFRHLAVEPTGPVEMKLVARVANPRK
jgi:hypothetical protein